MKQIIECVPNFSEGCRRDVINQITGEITSVDGIRLLDVDPGKETNRTVVTFIGSPEEVTEGAFRAIRKAAQLINMAVHKGVHPRMGATDVCPFIPVSGITKEECVVWAKRLAKRVGEELAIPVYLYGHAATRPERKNLPDIREGEYEALPGKMKNPDWKPDEGPHLFNPSAGATVIGVRDFMLAYNVNLNTADARLAKEIALTIRESGRAKRDADGAIIKDARGETIKVPGTLTFCQAEGWYVETYRCAQVTMNLHNYPVVGLHTAFDAVCEEAARLGLRVTGSELVGLVPKQSLLDAGVHYLHKQGKMAEAPEKTIIHTAIRSLGLCDVAQFKPEEKIIEYAMLDQKKQLVDCTVEEFVNELSSDSPAPGGGSVSALSGALSAALTSMVANLTYGKKEYQKHNAIMENGALQAQVLKKRCLELVDLDTGAFNAYMSAMRLPKKTDVEKKHRDEMMEVTIKHAIEIPFETLRHAVLLVNLSETMICNGAINALSDAAVSALQAEAAAEGAWMNVIINLSSVHDDVYVEKMKRDADDMLTQVKQIRARIIDSARKKLEK
jgi:glutamate formiminotransferase/formiminotetrahydrofolate cyclodeaminase